MIQNIYLINLINFVKSKKYRIGFVIYGLPLPYGKIMASTRIRVYDVIKMFWKNKNYLVELYNPLKKYNVVIFQKKFNKKALKLAKKLKHKKTKIILDININYYDVTSKFITKEQNKNILAFTDFADEIIVPTEFLALFIKKLFPQKPIKIIEENISKIFFEKQKQFNFHSPNLIWCGYADKAIELLLIQDTLKKLYRKQKFNLILICEKNPYLKIGKIPIYFNKYNYYSNPNQLLKGDIFIAPRNLNDSYNLGHSFTKIGVAMAIGLPVMASPVPSYLNSPAILCNSQKEWEKALIRLFTQPALLKQKSEEGILFVKRHYSAETIKLKYKNLFKQL